MSENRPTRGGRRSAARSNRLSVTGALAVLLPLLTAGTIAVTRTSEPTAASHSPASTTLTTATLVCPAALPNAPRLSLTTVADDVRASVAVGLGKDTTDADLTTGRVTTVDRTEAAAVVGEDAAAPGLVAGRSGGSEQAVTGCLPPQARQWFTGLGAGASHRSVLELTNPDAGTAVADVTVLGRNGVVDAPRLRGVSVPGNSAVRLDLAALIPTTEELALEVVVARGRLGAATLDRVDEVGSAPVTQDWLPAQAEPSTDNRLLGLAPGSGRRMLAIANPGQDEVRAQFKVVDTESVFAPDGIDEIRVPPQSVVRLPVTAVVDGAVREGAVGIEITSTGPVTATLRSLVAGDLSMATAGEPFDDPATVLLPEVPGSGPDRGRRQVVLAAATRAGAVTVTARDADGKRLDRTTVEVVPDSGARVEVPVAARLLEVTPARTSLYGAVLTSSGRGASVLPLTVPVRTGLVPDVRPGLP